MLSLSVLLQKKDRDDSAEGGAARLGTVVQSAKENTNSVGLNLHA